MGVLKEAAAEVISSPWFYWPVGLVILLEKEKTVLVFFFLLCPGFLGLALLSFGSLGSLWFALLRFALVCFALLLFALL